MLLAGAAASCATPGAVANPYFNAPAQPMIDPGQSFIPYTNFPGGVESYAVSFGAPYVATIILNYKHDKFAITPSLQFQGGARYGEPESTNGIDPTTCGAPLTPTVGASDPRYPYGNAGGGAFDATNCGSLVIPDPYTHAFDGVGSFVQPNQLVGNIQLSYDVSPKITIVGTLANVINTCWGGTKAAWTLNDKNVCSYNLLNNGGGFGPVGNIYNPPASVGDFPRILQYPYGAYLGAVNVNTTAGNFNQTKQPFQFFVEARIKL
jgi:hypothetical protein